MAKPRQVHAQLLGQPEALEERAEPVELEVPQGFLGPLLAHFPLLPQVRWGLVWGLQSPWATAWEPA